MFISPVKAIENGWIVGNITPTMVQPNGIDFTLDQAYQPALSDLRSDNVPTNFVLSKDSFKQHRKWKLMDTYVFEGPDNIEMDAYRFEGRHTYDVSSNLKVSLPTGVAAFIIGRSTLNRNSIFLTSGLYDSGFSGYIGCQLHNNGQSAIIERGARIGQIVFVEAASAKSYSGQYNNLSEHWSEKNGV